VELSGEGLSRYSSTIESAGLRKYPYYHCPSKKVDVTVAQISESLTRIMAGKNSWHRHGMKKLRQCIEEKRKYHIQRPTDTQVLLRLTSVCLFVSLFVNRIARTRTLWVDLYFGE